MGSATFPEKSVADDIQKLEYQSAKNPTDFTLIYIWGFIHILGILGVILFPPKWQTLVACIMISNFVGLGVTLGFHRCLTHRSFMFKKKWLERVFVTMGTINSLLGPIWWCSIHRLHHKYSDSEQDPHNSRRGIIYSHAAWITYLDPNFKPLGERHYPNNVKDIWSDPYYRWLDRFWYIPLPLHLFLLLILGGWYWFFWGGILPIIYSFHVTQSVNSLTHVFGYRSFRTKPSSDRSKNNFLIGILALGEGWHNNHHAFPSSANHGHFKWWEFDLTYFFIWMLHKLRLIDDLKTVTPEQIQATLLKATDPIPQTAGTLSSRI